MTEPQATAQDEALIEHARRAAEAVAGSDAVGDYAGFVDESGDGVSGPLSAHQFTCLQPGYIGWYWSVSMSAGPTVNDVVLLPGERAIVAPEWTPYRERIRPGDLGPGDVLPPDEDDIRLVPAWSAGDSQDTVDRYFAREVGLGREWVLSLEGRALAADRWMTGETGPAAPIAQQAPAPCSTCGFLISLAGPLSDSFGVCANGMANSDGRVVALTHGCGAHSRAKLSRSTAPQVLPPPAFDTLTVDEIVDL
ncbi:MAG: DUF3027 domain-containing protein [Aeromicrobium sp.]